jgi:hypothetical protein
MWIRYFFIFALGMNAGMFLACWLLAGNFQDALTLVGRIVNKLEQ